VRSCLQVFTAVGGPNLLSGRGQSEWDACIKNASPPPPGSNIKLLDLLEQVGKGGG
jgi:hypothetical protein